MTVVESIKLIRQSVVWLVTKLFILAMLMGGAAELLISKWERNSTETPFVGDLSVALSENNGFERHSTGVWLASHNDASLTYDLNGKYIAQIKIRLEGARNTPVHLTAYGDEGVQILTLTPDWQARLKTTPYQFMHTAVFELKHPVHKLEIKASGAGLGISSVVAAKGFKYDWGRMWSLVAASFLILLGVATALGTAVKFKHTVLLTGLAVGTLMATHSPLNFVSWDESIHYRRTDMQSLHGVVNQPVRDVFWRAHVLTNSYSIIEQDQINAFFDHQPAPTDLIKKPTSGSRLDAVFHWYREVGYTPAAAGLLLGRALGLPNHEVFKAGRLFNAVIYAIVIFLAVRVTPVGKLTFAAIGLLPTAIFLSAHYSYDPWITSWSLLGLALFLKAATQGNAGLSILQKAALIGAPFIAVGPKPIYCLAILLPLLLPANVFQSKQERRYFQIAVILAFLYSLSSFMLSFLIDGPGRGDSRGGAGVNSTEQVAYVLSNPAQYTKDLISFMVHYLNPMNMQGLAVDYSGLGSFQGFGVIISIIAACWLIDTMTSGKDYSPLLSSVAIRSFLILASVATVALIASALYVAFTPVGSHWIQGVQPRYLIPILPFALVATMPFQSRIQDNFAISMTNRNPIIVVLGLVAIYGIWTNLISNYY